MKNRMPLYVAIVLICSAAPAGAQWVLGDPINTGVLPGDDEAICDIPIYPDIMDYVDHFDPGETVPDFTLFDLYGNPFNLGDVLSDGKPVLLIAASYTCYVYRDKVPAINLVQTLFGDQVHIAIVYNVEAHPSGDVSPYFGSEYPGAENIADGILYPQPTTYGERKELVSLMMADLEIDVPVFIDGPCNEWWLNYGSYPNSAYLIDTNGTVVEFQDWFNSYPYNIFSTLEEYFSGEVITETDPTGDFVLGSYDEDCTAGEPGATIVSHVTLSNVDTIDALVTITKMVETIPGDWNTSICTDVCYPPDVLTANMIVPAGEEAAFTFYFYTGDLPDEGEVDLQIQQAFDPALTYDITLKACTSEETTSIVFSGQDRQGVMVYPNPADERLTIHTAYVMEQELIRLVDATGRTVIQHRLDGITDFSVDVSGLPAGIYTLVQGDGETIRTTSVVIQ